MITFTYKKIIKPILFRLDPETVHNFFIYSGRLLGKFGLTRRVTSIVFKPKENARLKVQLGNVEIKNPIGLSAGFDKEADLVDILPSLGFGYQQVGTVTLNPDEGNKGKRLVRLKTSKSIIVNYGLKNDGAEEIIKRLKNRKVKDFPLSISIGKTNADYTSSDEAGIKDYFDCLKRFMDENIGQIYTINISCPNTFGGEPFTTPDKLERLLNKLSELNHTKPVFLKMPIDKKWDDFKKLIDVVLKYEFITGVVIGNLAIDRESMELDELEREIAENSKGGISGSVTTKLCNTLIRETYLYAGDELKIIGVGGIFSANDAYEKIKLGATAVQLITGMIFEGPSLIKKINKDLIKFMDDDGFVNISEAMGKSVRNSDNID